MRKRKWAKCGMVGMLALLPGALLTLGIAGAWTPDPAQIPVKPQINVEDKDDIHRPNSNIWVLDFKFTPPQLITVDIPGRGRKLCWYMLYQVINNATDHEPHTFIPKIELVTHDRPGVYADQPLPKVQEAVRLQIDPQGYKDLKNSVTIASKPIPPSTATATRAVNGVAIWDDVNPDANVYSIFVGGLSNGYSLAEIPPDNKQVVRRKTLQLNFRRVGDRFNQQSGEIHFQPPAEWVYRATDVTLPAEPKAASKDKAK